MIDTLPDILARIVEHKKAELAASQGLMPAMEALAEAASEHRRNFTAGLLSNAPAILAEIKKASPSKGVLSADFQPGRIARDYEAGGAAAISVLTDARFFAGSLRDLDEARSSVDLPVLRKDFTIDPYHVVEAAASGADAILLIAAILDCRELRDLRELASGYGMASLVEVHDQDELAKAVDSGAEIVGVNNRNLHTFEVNVATSLRLSQQIPNSCVRVSESGIESPKQIAELRAAGYHAFLIGEHLMKSPDPRQALRDLLL